MVIHELFSNIGKVVYYEYGCIAVLKNKTTTMFFSELQELAFTYCVGSSFPWWLAGIDRNSHLPDAHS